MSQDLFKAPKMKRTHSKKDPQGWSPPKKKKIKKGLDFLSFCDIVLQYTKYESAKQEELRKNNTSPLDSGGSTAESFSSESTSSSYTEEGDSRLDLLNRVLPLGGISPLGQISPTSTTPHMLDHAGPALGEDDDDNAITCFCRKPYGGRPMIQCDDCLRWIHYSCAKIRKNKIPDIYTCQQCRDNKAAKRKSGRMPGPVFSKSPSPHHS